MRRIAASLLLALVVSGTAPAHAQQTCPDYRGIVCDGWVTDAAGVVVDDANVERAAQRFVDEYGHEIAVVVVPDAQGLDPRTFAEELGNTWGVGDPAANDGIVVLVALAERRTEIVTGPGLPLTGLDSVAGAGNGYFADGDFDGGLVAIITALGIRVSGGTAPDGDAPDDSGFSPFGFVFRIGWSLTLIGIGSSLFRSGRRRRRAAITSERERRVDAALGNLEPDGADLPTLDDYALAPPSAGDTTVGIAVPLLQRVIDDLPVNDSEALNALWRTGAITAVDRDRLLSDAAVPLELRASQENRMLEDAVQDTARQALEIDLADTDRFEIEFDHLVTLVGALRPHRLASARRRAAEALADGLTSSPIGWVGATDLGRRFLETAPALDPADPLGARLIDVDAAFAAASAKVDTLTVLHTKLPDSTVRPAVAAALADVADTADAAVTEFERVQSRMERRRDELEADGLEPAAIGALLLLNNDGGNVDEFLDTYHDRRTAGSTPAVAVEQALAGLRDPDEIERITEISSRLTLPISIATALVRRRDDGVEVYEALLAELASFDVEELDTRRTIAGVLAISLEPAQAVRRWKDARAALSALGLIGAYADVAAAFGASDARGPRAFAISYAAIRQALARSDLDAATDRFAPELAHEGTRPDHDSWTGEPIPATFGSFDPITFFYHHWVITKGSSGSLGWEPVHKSPSWSSERSSWWSGGGGFGSSGSSWGSSSWGSSSSGGFGGFSGGGGFGGGGSSGGSGW